MRLSKRVEYGHLISVAVPRSLLVHQMTFLPFIFVMHRGMIRILVLPELITLFTVFLVIK